MKPKHIGLKPNLNIIIIFNNMRKHRDIYEELKNYIINIEELLTKLITTVSCFVACLLITLKREDIGKIRKKNEE